MTTLDSFGSIVEVLRAFNDKRQQIAFKKDTKLFPIDYKDFSRLYEAFIRYLSPYPDLLLERLRVEFARNDKRYNNILSQFLSEAHSFSKWYLDNNTIVDSLFSHEGLSRIIDLEIEEKFGFEKKQIDEECNKIFEDEPIYHELARAYGSRVYGGRDESSFNKEDWEYIQPSLSEFKTHFEVVNVNLKDVYDRYEKEIKVKYLECIKKKDSIYRAIALYRTEVEKRYIEDVFLKINFHLNQMLDLLGKDLNNTLIKRDNVQKDKNRKGRYENLAGCIPRKAALDKVHELAEEYYKSHTSLDGTFGYMIYKYLDSNGFFNERGCTQEHFGELLIKEFGHKCSFRKGDAISDAKNSFDNQFDKQIKDAFKDLK